jgi:hypothetical protein
MDKTWEANADLSSNQFRFVKGVAGPAGGVQGRVGLATIGTRSIGILQNKPDAAGKGAVVRLSGTSKLQVDGSGTAITVGLPLKPNAIGRGIAASTDKDHVGAIAMEPSTAAGDVIEVILEKYDLGA